VQDGGDVYTMHKEKNRGLVGERKVLSMVLMKIFWSAWKMKVSEDADVTTGDVATATYLIPLIERWMISLASNQAT
jgi:hypothetical protein